MARAKAAAEHAYAPYSKFTVGAAVIDDRGLVFSAANVENASFGLTVCAERIAVFKAISEGAKSIRAVAVYSPNLHPVTPCGACRQVLAEFSAPAVPVLGESMGQILQWTVGELLPSPFDPKALDH